MQIIETKSYKQTLKKLNKYKKEMAYLEKIIFIIKRSDSIKSLLYDNEAKLYNFEKLKHFKEDIYSFNLSKNSGVIRLIINEKENKCYLLYISYKHYKDFDLKKVIYNGN